MSARPKRLALLTITFGVIAVALVACQAPTSPVSSANNNGVNVFHTPNPNLASPSPTFPPFTVGAWPSNYSPGNKDNITIYVLCRVQDPTMNGPAKPPAQQLQVTVNLEAPVNQTYSGQTDADGLAAIPIQFDDPSSGLPVVVDVVVNYSGQTFEAQTFFTPNPTASPTPTAGPAGTPGGATPTTTGG